MQVLKFLYMGGGLHKITPVGVCYIFIVFSKLCRCIWLLELVPRNCTISRVHHFCAMAQVKLVIISTWVGLVTGGSRYPIALDECAWLMGCRAWVDKILDEVSSHRH